MRSIPRHARTSVWALSISLAATLEIDFSFSSSPYLDVSVQEVPSVYLCIQYTVTEVFSARFPHSDIHASLNMCFLTWLFAAYHVLHRLPVPRHPPCALLCLTICFRIYSVICFRFDWIFNLFLLKLRFDIWCQLQAMRFIQWFFVQACLLRSNHLIKHNATAFHEQEYVVFCEWCIAYIYLSRMQFSMYGLFNDYSSQYWTSILLRANMAHR